jgi:predicted nucleic acid-binding protein
MIMSDLIAIDSNVMLYALNENEEDEKRLISLQTISNLPFISSQSLSEVINVCHRRWKYDKSKLIRVAEFITNNCRLLGVNEDIVRVAHLIILKYDLQYFDSLIVASALEAKCKVLYSEDMQHQLIIEHKLKILNPFI